MIDFSRVHVLCIGDVVLDRFVSGDVQKISREAPVPVFCWRGERTMLGGVGNVVANLRTLDASATLIARIGRDAEGAAIRGMLDKAGVRAFLLESERTPTIQKTRFVAKGHHVLKVDRDGEVAPDEQERAQVLEWVRQLIETVDVVVLSDYANGLLSAVLSRAIIQICRTAGVPVFVDPRGKDYGKYAGVTLVKPNRQELEIAMGVALDPQDPNLSKRVVEAARGLLVREGIETAVVTLSERGMICVSRGEGEQVSLPSRVVDVCDVSGAGDTTMAVLAAARAAKLTMRDSMELANAAAGIVVGKVGTATVSVAELVEAREGNGKILPLSALVQRVRNWQEEGLRIGFTNGCFDCLHCGHLSSLYQTKEHCDKLVVAVNADSSVRRLKGPTRPIQDERTRSQVIAGLELVDAVTVFEEDTAAETVEAVRPDVYAKEGYAMDDLPEAKLVKSYGGEVFALKRLDGYSTSEMVSRIGG